MRSAGIGKARQERAFLSWGTVNKVERTEDLGRWDEPGWCDRTVGQRMFYPLPA